MCGTGVGAHAGIEFDGSPPRAAGAPQHYRANPGRNDSGDLGGEGPSLRLGNAFAYVSPPYAARLTRVEILCCRVGRVGASPQWARRDCAHARTSICEDCTS